MISGRSSTWTAFSPALALSYADFEPWYTRAEHLYHVHGQRGADPGERPSAEPYRYPPLSHQPRIAQLEADSPRRACTRSRCRSG